MAQYINGKLVNNWVDDIIANKKLRESYENGELSVMTYKGSVDAVADLPTEGNAVGDFYNVTATGGNYAWDGSAWDEVTGLFDTSAVAGASGSFYTTANSDYDTDGEGWSSPVQYSAGVTCLFESDGKLGARAARSNQFGTVKLSIAESSPLDAGGTVGINTSGQLLVKPIATTSDCNTSGTTFGTVAIGKTSYVGTSSAYVGLTSAAKPTLVVGKASSSAYGTMKVYSAATTLTTAAGLLINSSGYGYIAPATTSTYGAVKLSDGIIDSEDTGVPTGAQIYSYLVCGDWVMDSQRQPDDYHVVNYSELYDMVTNKSSVLYTELASYDLVTANSYIAALEARVAALEAANS